jgi:hypothetical protein
MTVQADGMLNTAPISLVVILQLIRARTPAIQTPHQSPIKALKLTVPRHALTVIKRRLQPREIQRRIQYAIPPRAAHQDAGTDATWCAHMMSKRTAVPESCIHRTAIHRNAVIFCVKQ